MARKSSKEIFKGRKPLLEKLGNALLTKDGVDITARGLTFHEYRYASQSAAIGLERDKDDNLVDMVAYDIALRVWYLRFGLLSVGGTEIPRERINLGVADIFAIPQATLEPVFQYPLLTDMLFQGILQRTTNTPEELDGLDFTTLFAIPTSPAGGKGDALSAQA